MPVKLVSVEMEGGWSTTSMNPSTRPLLRHDGSVDGLSDINGEVSPTGGLPIPECVDFIKTHFPTRVNRSCGFHVHVSFDTHLEYMQIMTNAFNKYFRERIKLWADKLDSSANSTANFWSRYSGENRYCKNEFYPEKQIDIMRYDDERYTALNYSFMKHGTLECRLFPMFEKPETCQSAMLEFIDICNGYLAKRKFKEANHRIDIVDDEPELLEEEITTCV